MSDSLLQNSANRLQEKRFDIELAWEARVRKAIEESRAKSSLVLQDTLNEFLKHLIGILRSGSQEEAVREAQVFSKAHGSQRAKLQGYYLPQLLKEFSVLRDVLILELGQERDFSHEARSLVDKTIDTAMSAAAEEFTRVQGQLTQDSLTRAESSNLELDQFASVAAHDLKAPLATVLGYAQLLQDEYATTLGEEGTQFLTAICSAANRMRVLVDTLLEYARISTEKRQFQAFSSKAAALAAIDNLHDTIESLNAKVSVGPMPVIICDPPLLTQVFQNLIANSLKFHGDLPPQIEIHAVSTDDDWVYSIKDNGIGFDPTKAEEIFGLYRRLHGLDQYQGSGIGLAACKKAVELHGGRIWAESELGRGSTFFFTIPRSLEQVTH